MGDLNILLSAVGRRSYMVRYFKEALGDSGKVYAINSDPISPAFEVADGYAISPLSLSDEYIPFMIDYCKQHDITAVISLFDIDAAVLAKHKGALADAGIVAVVSDHRVFRICNDKLAMAGYLRGIGVGTAEVFTDVQSAARAARDGVISYPLIVKPRWGMGSIGLFVADDEEELGVMYRSCTKKIKSSYLKYESSEEPERSVLIQQFIRGDEYNLDVINDLRGDHVATIAKKKLAMRAGETDTAAIVYSSEMEEIGQRLSEGLRHIADLDVDVMRDGDRCYVIDMNARFGGGYPFSHIAGANLPMAITRWLRGKRVEKNVFAARDKVIGQKDIAPISLGKGTSQFCHFLPIHIVDNNCIKDFIVNEIEPFLSIELSKKLTVSSMDEYVKKIKDRADGWVLLNDDLTEIAGVVIGYIRNRYDKDVYITMFGVGQKYRGKRLSSVLLKKFLSAVPEDGRIVTNVDVDNIAGRKAYSSFGFIELHHEDGRLTIRYDRWAEKDVE